LKKAVATPTNRGLATVFLYPEKRGTNSMTMTAGVSAPITAATPMTFQEMRDIDIRSVDVGLLVDIKDVQINTSLPRDDRVLDFLEQIKNPYCFKVGKAAVKVSFADTEATVEDCLERYLLSL